MTITSTGLDFATISGPISGATRQAALTINGGAGILYLTGVGTYSGNTTIAAGTLAVTSVGGRHDSFEQPRQWHRVPAHWQRDHDLRLFALLRGR